MPVVGPGVGGAQPEPAGETVRQGDPVAVGPVPVTLVRDEQPTGAAGTQIGVASGVHHGNDDVAAAQIVAVTAAEPTDPGVAGPTPRQLRVHWSSSSRVGTSTSTCPPRASSSPAAAMPIIVLPVPVTASITPRPPWRRHASSASACQP